MSSPKRKHRSATQIRKILADFRKSGLSQRQFASRRTMSLSTLQSWVRKHPPAVTNSCRPEVISVGTYSGPPPLLEIEFPGGEVLRIGAGCRVEDIRGVLAELRRC